MHRQSLLNLLHQHQPCDAHEAAMLRQFVAFVEQHPDCFERSLTVGHVTGSAWILDRDRTHVLLTHHRKLNKWLQPGGHADGDADVLGVALREAVEETGLTHIEPASNEVFDVDIHAIPARGHEPQHFHYDVRFLFHADRNTPLVITEESHDLAWVPLDNVRGYDVDESVLRMVAKTPQL
jgi:8-oxo-dGTP pyrophosphatase MutT (NUDIX family)